MYTWFSRINSWVQWARGNLILSGVLGVAAGLVALYICYKILGLVSGALTVLIWWGAAVNAAQVCGLVLPGGVPPLPQSSGFYQ